MVTECHAVIVEFRLHADRAEAFARAVLDNARASLAAEPGCRVFDVCRDPADATRFLLYELYDDEAAFRAHLATPHFESFDQEVKTWVMHKAVQAFHKLSAVQAFQNHEL
jgi:(4S)-4-hydroxy-5-phosphonooxypentane-2,3-dione isomerase